jgi:hypothetical protein
MQAGAPAPEGQEVPDVIDVIVQALSEIPKLKGQVWIGGDILLNPESVNADGDWSVTIWLSDPTDKATITNWVRKNLPELYNRLEFHAGEPSGEEPAMPVGGEQPEMPVGGEMPMPQEGAMPEAMEELV